jgi:dipeptidyl aminopeptidase/acylaminoacyl peptidase
MHGKLDTVVPYQHGLDMHQKLKSLRRVVEFVPFELSGHNNVSILLKC